MRQRPLSVLLSVLLTAVLAGVTWSPVQGDQQHDASFTCGVSGPHDCQILLPQERMMFRRGVTTCGDRNIIDLLLGVYA